MASRRLLVLLSAVAFASGSCAANGDGDQLPIDTTFAAEMASSWHWVGDPQRVQIGIRASSGDGVTAVSGGTVDLAFAFVGTGGDEPVAGPTATASYIAVPGTEPAGEAPGIVTGARGIYEAEDVVFDRAGIWQVTVSASIDGVAQRLTATTEVFEDSPIPAPGDRAPRTETLTVDSDVREGAIDSMADGGGPIPDPELHEWTIARAIREGRPTLVLFGTPAYCTSLMCGPEVQEVQRLAADHPDRAVYIHVEIWKDHDGLVVNRGAADWLLWQRPDGTPEMTEPWLYLIGADGMILDRWGSLFDPAEVATALEALPPMPS
ncbi:MAG TPA: hypothetical protein VFQ40_03995 [Actinomycetota bacterium]|nr:hypothetical protein [Actinomycetota bacterium]